MVRPSLLKAPLLELARLLSVCILYALFLVRVSAWSYHQRTFLDVGVTVSKRQRQLDLSVRHCAIPFRQQPTSLHSFPKVDDDDSISLNDHWVDEDVGEWMMEEGPDAYLNDDDLFLLHDITFSDIVPTSRLETDGGNVSSLPMISEDVLNQLSSDLSYFFLRDEIGLSQDAMWKITNKAGSILGLKASTIRTKIDLLKTTLGFTAEELRALITTHPNILAMSAAKNLSPKIEFFVQRLDFTPHELKNFVLGCPTVLTYSMSNLEEKIKFFTNTLDLSVDDTRNLLLKEPRVMTSSPETGMQPRYQFFLSELDFSKDDLRSLVRKNPSILQMSVEDNLQPKLIFYLIMTLHMTPSMVRKTLMRFPQFLNYNLENHIMPITRYFLSLDIAAHEYAQMLIKFPRLITNSLSKIKYMVGYLRFELALEADDVRRILYQCPQVVSLSSENLESKVAFLLQAASPGGTMGHESSTDILRKLVVGMPNLLKLNVEKNLAPKISYLQSILTEDACAEVILRMPALLAYSLENRIKPRMEKILAAGVSGESITVGIAMSEEAFDSWLLGRARKANQVSTKKRRGKTSSEQALEEEDDKVVRDIRAKERAKYQPTRVEEEDGRVVHWVRRMLGGS